jgi:hypothetical protein
MSYYEVPSRALFKAPTYKHSAKKALESYAMDRACRRPGIQYGSVGGVTLRPLPYLTDRNHCDERSRVQTQMASTVKRARAMKLRWRASRERERVWPSATDVTLLAIGYTAWGERFLTRHTTWGCRSCTRDNMANHRLAPGRASPFHGG